MSSCLPRRKSHCERPTRRHVTLSGIVRDYIENYRASSQRELSFFEGLPFSSAIEHAALAKDHRGKRYSHQRRLTRVSLAKAKTALMAARGKLEKATTFDEVFQLVGDAIATIWGLGELYIYDTALRIAAARRIVPTAVYLHAGTRTGAKRLRISTDRTFVPIADLRAEFRSLKAHEIEDLLCIYKNQLGAV